MKKTIPLSIPCFRGNERKYVNKTIDSSWVSTGGEYVTTFENNFSQYVRCASSIATCNGTSALHISLIESGVGHGNEVIVPTVTFIAPINAVAYTGAAPVFMDCDSYLNIDINKVEQFITKECKYNGKCLVNKRSQRIIKAIIPVHVFGHPADLEPLLQLANKYNITIIEDATESLGSYYKQGPLKNKMTGTISDIGCYSFNGNKIITTGGGGMIVSNDGQKAKHMKYLTTQAKNDDLYYVHDEVGYNYRMTNLQAALGVAQLEKINEYIEIKRRNYLRYKNHLEGYRGLSLINEPEYSHSNYWFYSLVVNEKLYGPTRNELMNKLISKGIQSRPIWKLNHLQKPYAKCQNYKIVNAEILYEKVLNLPCSVNLSADDIDNICKIIKN